ncbi:hypothetical protein SDC9_201738 [bioreactor metagenome]|uniref:Uncharacterized protein n=1 Tax=bioreactor metagenome TaxID=1076179 RepID=A0A645IUI2_9ZZZZ
MLDQQFKQVGQNRRRIKRFRRKHRTNASARDTRLRKHTLTQFVNAVLGNETRKKDGHVHPVCRGVMVYIGYLRAFDGGKKIVILNMRA